jgi:hypothetical protein
MPAKSKGGWGELEWRRSEQGKVNWVAVYLYLRSSRVSLFLIVEFLPPCWVWLKR